MPRAPRKNKALEATGVQPTIVPAPADVVTPTPAPEIVADTLAAATVPAEKAARVPNVPAIATSRVKNAVNAGLLNAVVATMSRDIKDQLEKFSEDDTSPEKLALTNQKIMLTKSKTRFSGDCFSVLGAAATVLARALISKAMTEAAAKKVKTANISHLYASDLVNYEYYLLLAGLPVFEAGLKVHLAQKAQIEYNEFVRQRLIVAEREFRKKYKVTKSKAEGGTPAKPEDKPKPAEEPAEEPADEPTEDSDDISFVFYVGAICEDLKKTFVGLRTGKKFQRHISQIILQFVQRTTHCASIITDHMDNKTINGKTIQQVLRIKFVENEPFTESVSFEVESYTDVDGVEQERQYANRQVCYENKAHAQYFAALGETLAVYYPKPVKKEKSPVGEAVAETV